MSDEIARTMIDPLWTGNRGWGDGRTRAETCFGWLTILKVMLGLVPRSGRPYGLRRGDGRTSGRTIGKTAESRRGLSVLIATESFTQGAIEYQTECKDMGLEMTSDVYGMIGYEIVPIHEKSNRSVRTVSILDHEKWNRGRTW